MTSPIASDSAAHATSEGPELPLRVTRWAMPFLLRCAMVLFSVMGASFALFSMLFIVLILFGHGPFDLYGTAVTKKQFIVGSASFLFLTLPAIGIYFCATAFALIKERSWSRPLLALYCPLIAAFMLVEMSALKPPAPESADQVVIAEFAVLGLIGLWYLYRKRSVVGYYRALRMTESSSLP